MERAEHYRGLAKRYLRLAALTEYPNHYLRIAVQYNALAEAEELSADGHWHFDGFGVAYDVLAPPTSEGLGAYPRPLVPMVLSVSHPRPRRSA